MRFGEHKDLITNPWVWVAVLAIVIFIILKVG